MRFYVPYTPDSNGIITTSFSVFDSDQDTLTLISVSVVNENGQFVTGYTPAWVSISVSGSYLVSGGYKGSMSKLDVFLYIDTNHPSTRTGSHYVLRAYYTDGINPPQHTDISFFNGDFDLWYPPNAFIISKARESSNISLPTAQIHISSSIYNYYYGPVLTYSNHSTLSHVFGYSISSYLIRNGNIAYYFPSLNNIKGFHLFIPFTFIFGNVDTTIYFRLRNEISGINIFEIDFINSNIIANLNIHPATTFSFTLSEPMNEKMVLFEYHIEQQTPTSILISVYINGIQIHTLSANVIPALLFFSRSYFHMYNLTNAPCSYNDLAMYVNELSEEEKRLIRNYYFFKYYPFLHSMSIWKNGVLV